MSSCCSYSHLSVLHLVSTKEPVFMFLFLIHNVGIVNVNVITWIWIKKDALKSTFSQKFRLNPGVFVPIMFLHQVVLYQILVRAEWVCVGWFCPGCIICNKVMWSSICFVYLLCKGIVYHGFEMCIHNKKCNSVDKAFSTLVEDVY